MMLKIGDVGVLVNDLDITGHGTVTRNNWVFEYYIPEGVTIKLTPSNDVNQVIKDGKVIAVFSKDDSYNLHKFLRSLT